MVVHITTYLVLFFFLFFYIFVWFAVLLAKKLSHTPFTFFTFMTNIMR